MRPEGAPQHYERLAAAYDENWVYGPDHIPWLAGQLAEALSLRPQDRIADIGCGTGLFAREIAAQLEPEQPIVCVDPSASMLERIADSESLLTPLHAAAQDIAEGHVALPHAPVDAMLLKEVVHHLADPAKTLAGLAARLAPGGRLLVAMLPARIEYPLFEAALRRYEELQPDPRDMVTAMEAAGLRAELRHVEYEVRMPVERYVSMVESRYMSLLSTFSDAEIARGVAEIRAAHPSDQLSFPDRFAFVLGVRER